MAIRKLPTLLVNQIAAGEVIERPASVVKELVENSLDAGAQRIDVSIEDGGRQLIRVSDDGGGIPADELVLAVAPHATSKLQSADQLASVGSLGFRGEALASIASVSRLRITSRATVDGQVAESGAMLEATGDEVQPVVPAACAPGSVIEVRDLFYNTPARRKFLRAAPHEFGQISDTLARITLCWPNVAFKLEHNGRRVLDLPYNQSRRQRCLEVLGKELEEGLLEFDSGPLTAQQTSRVWGLAGVPSIARATSKFQYLSLNGRPIRDRNLNHAIREAYRGLIPPDRQPVMTLFLDVAPSQIDVNVHPAKLEVRFHEPSRIHGLVLSTIRQRLLGSDLTPRASLASAVMAGKDRIEEPAGNTTPATASTTGVPLPPAFTHSPPGSSAGPPAASTEQQLVDFFRGMDPRHQQPGFNFQQLQQQLRPPESTAPAEPSAAAPPAGESPQAFSPASQPLGPATPVMQVHNSYLITQDDQGILIVDQHALHERVMFEELRQRVLGHERLESQRLLMPAILAASARRQSTLEQLQPLLERIGIEAGPIGPASVAIQSFPTFLFDRGVEPAPFLEELLDAADEGRLEASGAQADEAALHRVLDMMACKAAVKAGDHMTDAELSALLAKREQVERASNCPHGRPTAIRLTLRDLEKQFKRT